jgi:2-haloacid dehalogenase
VKISCLTFDVFGTLLSFDEDCEWVRRYVDEIKAINRGDKPYRPLNVIFDEIDADWKSMIVRPGVMDALYELRNDYLIVSLSNANKSLAGEIANHFGLPWDFIVATEDSGAFKPDPRVYRLAISRLGGNAGRLLHVAAHKFDLVAAKSAGFHTAYVEWPGYAEPATPGEFDIQVQSLKELACLIYELR